MQPNDSDDLTADEIAAGLERDRADLAGTIDSLRERLSVDALMTDAASFAKTNLAPYTRALDGAVRANPLAAVLAGVGIAWLAFGRTSRQAAPEPALAGTKVEALSRWEDEGGPPAEPLTALDDDWIVEADQLRDRAAAALARIDAAARRKLRPAAEIARDRAEVLARLASSTRAAMLRRLETFSSDAQERILAAREQAYAARMVAVRQGTKLIEERPMVAGAIGMAIGAAVASALPRTVIEDRLFGQERDRLMRLASDALRHERSRAADAAGRVADTVAAEVKDGVRQMVTDVI
jgi:Protein of unknown function (DUF3618)